MAQIKTAKHYLYTFNIVEPGTRGKKTQHGSFWGQNIKWVVGYLRGVGGWGGVKIGAGCWEVGGSDVVFLGIL